MAFGAGALGRRLVPEGRALSSKISALAEETPESSLPLASREAMARRQLTVNKEVGPLGGVGQHFAVELPRLQNHEK